MSSSESNAVKWLPMGEIGQFVRGNGLQKKDFVDSGVGCIHYGEIYTYYGTSATETKSFVSEELSLKLKKAKHGDLVIATTSENVEDLCKAVAWLGEEEICIGGHSCLFRHNQNPKFLTYLTQTSLFSSYKRRYGQGVKVIEISCKKLETFELPIPSLAEQERIVAILDKYSSIKAQLINQIDREIELTLKQYEYYRDELLSFSDEIESEELGNIAEIGTGSSNTKDELAEGLYPFFVRSQIVRWQNSYEFDETAIITAGDGVGVGKVFHFISGKYALHQRAYRIHIVDTRLNPKFFFYYIKTQFLRYITKTAYSSSVTSLRKPMLNSFTVPLPPLAEQECIVAILDKYSESVEKHVSNLRREKELVQKQYEYYREKLLTF